MNQVFHTPRGEYVVISSPVLNNKLVDMTLDIYEKKDLGDGKHILTRVLLLPLVVAKDTEQPSPQKKSYLSTVSTFVSK